MAEIKHLEEWQVLLLCQNLIGELDLQQWEAVNCCQVEKEVGPKNPDKARQSQSDACTKHVIGCINFLSSENVFFPR